MGISYTEISKFTECFDKKWGYYEFKKVGSLDNHILKYRSESIFPSLDKIDRAKKKVMLIFGNPAINSVIKGMFFYPRQDGRRHQLWGKLEKADLLSKEVRENINNRKIEASRIRERGLPPENDTSYNIVKRY